MVEFTVRTSSRNEMLDITGRVNSELQVCAGNSLGVCLVFIPHTTAGVTINEGADPDVKSDMLADLSGLAPKHPGQRHVEGNSDAHLKSTLTGVSLPVPFISGSLSLGQWQSLYLCEFDGPRTRRVQLHVQKTA